MPRFSLLVFKITWYLLVLFISHLSLLSLLYQFISLLYLFENKLQFQITVIFISENESLKIPEKKSRFRNIDDKRHHTAVLVE